MKSVIFVCSGDGIARFKNEFAAFLARALARDGDIDIRRAQKHFAAAGVKVSREALQAYLDYFKNERVVPNATRRNEMVTVRNF